MVGVFVSVGVGVSVGVSVCVGDGVDVRVCVEVGSGDFVSVGETVGLLETPFSDSLSRIGTQALNSKTQTSISIFLLNGSLFLFINELYQRSG